jgi:hypothetical protein
VDHERGYINRAHHDSRTLEVCSTGAPSVEPEPSRRTVRAFVGGGFGQLSNRGVQTCAPAGCERLMSILSSPVGRHARALSNMTIIGGVSGRITSRLHVRGGVRLHNLAGEGLSTAETFVGTSYRFPF